MIKQQRLNLVYHSMLARCYNPNAKSYKHYGERGITVCEEWLNTEKVCTHYGIYTKGWRTFEKWALDNGYKEGLTIDRIDNNKGYSPENCRWVDRKMQSNNRNFCRFITYKGKTQSLADWAKELKINYGTLRARLYKYNMSVERAFTKKTPRGKIK